MSTCHVSHRLKFIPAALIVSLGVAACGGGGGGGGDTSPTTTTRITGSVFAAPVQDGQLTVRDGAGAVVAGPVTTASDGTYSIDVPSSALGSELYFQVSGGSFTDEATGLATQLTGTDRLAAVAAAGSLASGGAVHLDPATTVVHRLVEAHGITRAEARLRFRNAFGFTPDPSVAPANVATAAPASCLAGLRAAAFSRLSLNLALSPGEQFELLDALARDLSDQLLDGEDADGPVPVAGTPRDLPADIQNGYENALFDFLGSPENLTGVGPEQVGFLSFAKVALTTSYRVEYVPVPPGAAVGRTPFQLSVTDKDTNSPVPGLGVSIRPTMHMASYDHSTPWEPVVDNGGGTYDGAVYYSMPGGEGFGHWSLDVVIDEGSGVEAATFHPVVSSLNVNMALLRGQDDEIRGVLGVEGRPYYLSDAGLALEGGSTLSYRFDLFVAAQEDLWNYPGLAPGVVLHDELAAPWTVSEAVVRVSLGDTDGDDIPDNWYTATSSGGGLWSVTGMTGIDPEGTELTFYVELSVNGESKTADGGLPTATNTYKQMVMGGASCCD